MDNPSIPDDVLVIHYLHISSNPLVRLEVCRAIGQLLDSSDTSLHLKGLGISPAAQAALQTWMAQAEVQRFWRIEGQTITVNEHCNQHLLVGTRHLLADLNYSKTEQLPDLKQLDVLWRAAAQLLTQP